MQIGDKVLVDKHVLGEIVGFKEEFVAIKVKLIDKLILIDEISWTLDDENKQEALKHLFENHLSGDQGIMVHYSLLNKLES